MGLHLFDSIKKFCDRHGPTIMSTPERALVAWGQRARPIAVEEDLEKNFVLLKDLIMACCEKTLQHPIDDDAKEIPHLADFEAGLCAKIILIK